MKIFLLEREKARAQAMRESLNDLGYECQTAETSQDLGFIFKELNPMLIVSVHSPPIINAMEVIRQWQQFSPKSFLVIASPDLDLNIACEATNAHVFAILPRSYELADLISLADRLALEVKETRVKEEQHSRLALEYAKLKTAFEDLRRKS